MSRAERLFSVTAVALLGMALASTAAAQFEQQIADAARLGIILGVSQGISSLPPTSGQSFVYAFDETMGTYVRSDLLGPTAFRSPVTIGRGKISLRGALSYFELSDRQRPIIYATPSDDPAVRDYTKVGFETKARVGLLDIACSIGPADGVELSVNLPIVSVDAHANALVASKAASPGSLAFAESVEELNQKIASGEFVIRDTSFDELGAQFNEGLSAGLGRVSLAAKGQLLTSRYVDMAASLEVFLRSPFEDQYAGTDSTAFLPRLIAAIDLVDTAKLHLDVGYEQDTRYLELSGLMWNAGTSYALPGFTVDGGVGGALYVSGIDWTPEFFKALGDTTLGTNYINFLLGLKVQLTETAVLSGAVNVPLNNDGIRAPAIGSLAFELDF